MGYDLIDVVERANTRNKNKVDADEHAIFPTDGIVPFPSVKYNGNVLKQDTSKLQINCIASTINGSFIVAASNCNMLCIYRPNPQLDLPTEIPVTADYDIIISNSGR